ncbi:MAG: sugar-binding transcriptional regulator [Candidatus Bathyarchaeia archaeon]
MISRKEILAIKAAKLYYKDNKTQEEIANILNISRSTVSRLLSWARNKGLVQITVAPLFNEELAKLLHEKYGKQFIIVDLEGENETNVINAIGSAAAMYFINHVNHEMTVGITWGKTIAQMVEHVPSVPKRNVKIVQMVGCLGNPQRDVHAPSLVLQLARRVNAQAVLLPAPGIVADITVKNALLKEQIIQDVFSIFSQIDIAFVGIGSLSTNSLIIQDSLLSAQDIEHLYARGAVGDIALRFFNAAGAAIETEVNAKVIGIDLERLKTIPTVVGVAGGIHKTQAIRGALRGDLIDVLITDALTAEHLLEGG